MKKNNVKVTNEARGFIKDAAYCAGIQLGVWLTIWGTKTLVKKITDKNKKDDDRKEDDNNEYNVVHDDKGNMIYEKYPNGHEYYHKYDDRNNKIYTKKYYNGNEYYEEFKFDDKGNMIYKKCSDGYGYYWEYKYDDKGNMIYEKLPSGHEYCYGHNNTAYAKLNCGTEYECKYGDMHDGVLMYREPLPDGVTFESKLAQILNDSTNVINIENQDDHANNPLENIPLPNGSTILEFWDNGNVKHAMTFLGDEEFYYDNKSIMKRICANGRIEKYYINGNIEYIEENDCKTVYRKDGMIYSKIYCGITYIFNDQKSVVERQFNEIICEDGYVFTLKEDDARSSHVYTDVDDKIMGAQDYDGGIKTTLYDDNKNQTMCLYIPDTMKFRKINKDFTTVTDDTGEQMKMFVYKCLP